MNPTDDELFFLTSELLRALDRELHRLRHTLRAAKELALALRDEGPLAGEAAGRLATVCRLLGEATAAAERVADLLPVPPTGQG